MIAFKRILCSVVLLFLFVSGAHAQTALGTTFTTGTLTSTTQVNNYDLTLAQAGKVEITFEHSAFDTSINGYWKVSVKTLNGAELMSFISGPKDGSKTVPVGLPVGVYRVQVFATTVGVETTLLNKTYQIKYTLAPTTASIGYEQQTGVATQPPTPMTAGVNYEGAIASTYVDRLDSLAGGAADIDSWGFTLAQAGNVSIRFEHEPFTTIATYWVVTVRTSDGAELMSFGSAQTTGSITAPLGLPAGSYVVQVSAYPNTSSTTIENVPYHLSYAVVTGDTFEKEGNATTATATPLALNTPYLGSAQPNAANAAALDADYYKLTLDYVHNVQIKLLPTAQPSSAQTLTLTNLTTSNVVYTGKTSAAAGINAVVQAPAGNYALSVTGSGGNLTGGVPYTLTVHDLGQAVQHTFIMGKGWNLLGNSFDVAFSAAEFATGSSAPVVSMWKWDASKTQWQFYAPSMSTIELASYAQGKGYGVLTQINPREGFWVNTSDVASSQVFTLVPTVLGGDDLKPSWNLVASGGELDPRQLNARLSDVPPSYSADPLVAAPRPVNLQTLWTWDNASSKWYFYAPGLDQPGASTALQNYIGSKNYLDFFATTTRKTIRLGSGFWVNK